jgi:hypothetical protein
VLPVEFSTLLINHNHSLQPCHDEEERKKKRAEKRYPYLIQRFDSYSKHLRTQHQLETKPPRRWSISVDSRIAERLGLFAYQQDEPLSTLNTTSAEGEGEGEGEAEGRRQKAEGEREPAKAGRRERERRRSTGRR